MSNPGQNSLAAAVNQLANNRQNTDVLFVPLLKEGWRIMDLKKERLVLKEAIHSTAPGTILNVPRSSRASDIFMKMICPVRKVTELLCIYFNF